MAGPWEQYATPASPAAEAGPWSTYGAPEERPTVKPGDVEARRRQVQAQAEAEEPNVVRERLTPGGVLGAPVGMAKEFVGGLGDIASNIASIASPEAYQGILANPIVGAGLGAARALAAPAAPLADLAAAGGEALSTAAQERGFTTLADILGATGMAAADVLAPMAAAKQLRGMETIAKQVPALEKLLLKSRRMQATEARKTLAEAEQASAKKIADIQADVATSKEGIGQMAEEASKRIPTKADLQKQFAEGAPLGKTVGKEWKESFSEKWTRSTERFNKQYGQITEEGLTKQAIPDEYIKAGGVLQEGKGVTGIPRTRPEAIADKLKATLDLENFDDSTFKALKEQLDSVPPSDRARVQGVIDEFVKASDMPEVPTVTDLILERQRLKAGSALARDDRTRNQFNKLIKGLEADITKADTPLAAKLFATDKMYATEHIPYFGRKSITRAIGEGKPEAVVDAIYRPTISATGKTGPGTKAVEAITRARELITDPQEWKRINKAFINKGIEQASDGDILDPVKMQKWWKSYKDPAGTANEVLRKGLGEREFRELDSVFSQLERAPQKNIDSIAKDLVKSFEGRAKEATALEQTQLKATKAMLEKEIASAMGTKVGRVTDRLQSIGAGVFTSGTVGGDTVRAMRGGYIMIGAKALGNMLESVRGRSLLKAVFRSSPNAAQRAAVARQVVTFADSIKANQEEE